MLVAGLLAAGLVNAAAAQQPATTEVSGVHLAYGSNPATEMTVTWTGPPSASGQLEVGQGDELNRTFEATSTIPNGSSRAVYHATATDLSPDTTYSYRTIVGQSTSEVRQFTTAPAPGEAVNLTITAFADHGTVHPANSRADGDNPTRVTELAADQEPTFHLHAGDTSYAEGDPNQWNTYLDQIEPLASTVPYMAVPGNHEREEPQGFSQYADRFKLPTEDRGLWWSFQYGNVLVVGLNSERACTASGTSEATVGGDPADDCETSGPVDPYEPQFEFFRDQLAQAAEDPSIDWRILLTHHLFWSSSSHAGAKGFKEHYLPLIDEYDVDLVVQGHDHVYERSKTLAGEDLEAPGTVYLTNGAGGSGNYGWAGDQPQWSAYRDNDHYGSIVLEIGPERLDGRFETLEDGAIDEFELVNVEDGGVRYAGDGTAVAGDPPADENDEEASTVPGPGIAAVLASLAAIALLRRR